MSYNTHRKAAASGGAWSDVCACALEDFVVVPPAAPAPTASTAAVHAPSYTSMHAQRRGVLRYVGPVDFADGLWAGVELVGTLGRNDGSVKGKQYFPCLPGQGLFVRPDAVSPFVPEQSRDAPPVAASTSTAASTEAAAEAAALRHSLDTALTRNIELEMEVDDLSAQLKRARQVAATHEKEKEKEKGKETEKVDPVSFSSPPPSAVPVQTPLTVSERIQLEMDVMELKDDLDAAQRALRTAEATIAQLRKAPAPATAPSVATTRLNEEALQAVRAQLEAKTHECEALRAQMEAAAELSTVADVVVAQAPDEGLADKVRALEAAKAQLHTDIETLWAEAAAAEASAAGKLAVAAHEHDAAVAAWAHERQTLSAAQHALVRQVTELQAALTEQTEAQALAAVSAETALNRTREEWSAKLQAADAATRDLQEILELTEHELLEEKKQTDQLTEVVQRLRDEAEARTDGRVEQLSALEVQNQRQSQDLLQAQRHVQALQVQLQNALLDQSSRAPEATDDTARTTTTTQAELDALKFRVFQLQKEKEVDVQLRARLEALSKELTACKADSRRQLEAARIEHDTAQARFTDARHALESERDALRRRVQKDETDKARVAHGTSHALAAATLDERERRCYLQWLIRSLQGTAPTRAADRWDAWDAVSGLAAGAHTWTHQRVGTLTESRGPSLSSALSSADKMEQCREAVVMWRAQTAESGSVAGVLDFTTPDACKVAVTALFSR